MTFLVHSLPKVLLVCSRTATCTRLQTTLQKLHYPTELAGDSQAALQALLGSTPPEIAIFESALAGFRGLEIAAEVKRRSQRCPPWMILICEEVDAQTVTSAMDAGIDDLLLHPVDEVDLKVRLGVAARVQALVSQLDAQTHAVRFHATHDSLTGLWNRESLLGMLFPETDRVQRMKTPLTLLIMDIDRFSNVNLDYGYEAGDGILQELANRFRRHLRSYDLIGRYGEDEFLIALPGCTSDQALALAIRMKKLILGKPFPVGRDMVTLTASMGIGQSHGRSPLVVLQEAERALAEAKLAGRNRVIDYQRDNQNRPEQSHVVELDSARLNTIITANDPS